MSTATCSLPSAVAHALLHGLWQGGLLAVLAAGAFRLLSPHRAAARHAVGLACLLAMALAPLTTFAFYYYAAGPSGDATSARVTPLLLRKSDWLVVAAPLLWSLGAAAMIARQLGGWRVVMALNRRPPSPIPPSSLGRVEVLRRALGIERAVALRAAAGTASPFTARTLRPVIWLPDPLWDRLPADQQDALLAHELAHIRRLDWLWNGLQSLVEALLFFQPAARWLGRRVRQEREHACDDLAAIACGDALPLAEALTVLERHRGSESKLVLTARGGALLQRVTRLLGSPQPAAARVPIWLLLWLAAGAALATQVQLPSDVLLNVRVDSSTDGPLIPGAFRELTAEAFATQRYYRSAMDDDGQIREHYEENGQPRPIDPAVRAWLNELTSTTGWR